MKYLLKLIALWMLTAFPVLANTDTTSRGKAVVKNLWSGRVSTVWGQMSPIMKKHIGTKGAFVSLLDGLQHPHGSETTLLSEHARLYGSLEVYERVSLWEGLSLPHRVITEIGFDSKGQICYFNIFPDIDYKTRTQLCLPFNEAWHVLWGGRTYTSNSHHQRAPAQRFALDLLVAHDGKTCSGDPAVLANYHCWNLPILAPAEGLVARVVDGLADQSIGTSDTKNPAGNHVVIDFGNGEYGVFAHFKQGSVRVKKGEQVTLGKVLGHCGNSGNSSEPHLHFHLQNCPIPNYGQGLPAQFINYMADGKLVKYGEPVRGQTIAPVR